MNTPLVSVIVPVYGVEKYIERCAQSIFEQTYQNIEIIFVNDCTPDKSMDILNKVMQEYPNIQSKIQIINHEVNGGSAITRKDGMLVAKGKYVIQWDSDDYVDVQFLEKMVALAEKEDADITICDMNKVYKDKIVHIHTNPSLDNIECLKQILIGKVHSSLCNKLIRRSLYVDNNIYPTEGINMCEDFSVMYRLLFFAKKITYLPEPLYNYDLSNGGSYTSVRMKPQYQLGFFSLMKQMEEFRLANNIDESINLYFRYQKIELLSAMVLYGDLEIMKENNIFSKEINLKDVFNHPNQSLHKTIALFMWKERCIFLLKLFRIIISFLQRVK